MAPEADLTGSYREWLARSLYCWLEWRAAQAEDRPADRRYVQAAKALYCAARDVMALPDDDPRLLHLAHVCDAGDGALREFLEKSAASSSATASILPARGPPGGCYPPW